MATPETDETDQASRVENPPAEKAPAPASPPKPRAGSFFSKLFLSVLTLLILLGIAGYGALIFRDADPRLGLAATYVDDGLKEARDALDKAQTTVAGLMGESPKPAGSKVTTHRTGALTQPPVAEPVPSPAPEKIENAQESKVEDLKVREPAPPLVEVPKAPEKPVASETPPPEPPHKPADIVQAPRPAAPAAVASVEPAPAPATPAVRAEAPDADGFTDRDLISALEGRIEALSDEVKTLREKLDAPKNETRAAPEAEVAKPEPPKAVVADGAATALVVAFALQNELAAGRPFSEEIAALSRIGAEPAPAPILIEISEKGAPTGARLREIFLPLVKKLKASESHEEPSHESGDLAEHLLQGASKLVKVHPTGQARPESLDGKLERIEAALTRDDFAAAENAFASLPESARAEASDFGEALRRRREADKAAEELLRGAIASIGAKK
jgi:hypothetical protein